VTPQSNRDNDWPKLSPSKDLSELTGPINHRDPGFDRRQHQPGHDTQRHAGVADRRFEADLEQRL
jgi:hypothetical protein